MYAEYFQLNRRPFSATPDPNCCYLAPAGIAQVLSDVVTALEGEQGIAVMTGVAGIGKSLLCNYLDSELQQRYQIALIGSCQFPTIRSLLQAILFELGEPYQGKTDQELRLELIAALKASVDQSEGSLLILDEAHLLSTRLLEEVRVLSDLSHNGHPLLRILLAGQPALDERLTEPACTPINQRIAVQTSLPTLTRQESMDYIDFRSRLAGQPATELFSLEAMLLIAQASDGLPRCINQLCDHALLLAYIEQAGRVSIETVRTALDDLQQLPLHWNPSSISLGPLDSLSSRNAEASGIADHSSALPLDDSGPLIEDFLEDQHSELDIQTELDIASEDTPPAASFEFGADLLAQDEPEAEAGSDELDFTSGISETEIRETASLDETLEGLFHEDLELEPPTSEPPRQKNFFRKDAPAFEETPPPRMNPALPEFRSTTPQVPEETFPENQALKNPAPPKNSSGKNSQEKDSPENLIAEERIFDRYASLDAGRAPAPPPVQSPASAPPPPVSRAEPESEIRIPSAPDRLRGPMSSAFFEHSAITPPYAGEGNYSSDPLDFIDEVVMPLIEHAERDELPTRSELDRRLNQFIAAQRAAVPRKPLKNLIDDEEAIGEEALDLCLEVQEAIGNTVELDPEDLADFSIEIEDLPPARNFPGAIHTSTGEVADFDLPSNFIPRADAAHSQPPAPKYQFVFSELRKRLRAEKSRRS